MTRLILALATAAAMSACSGARDRGTPATDDAANTARELRIARPDTAGLTDSINLAARGTQPVSPVEQQAPRSAPAPARRKPARHRAAPTAAPKPLADTASARGYAPNQRADSATAAPVRDTAGTQNADSARVTRPDTSVTPDTVTATSKADTLATASSPASDTAKIAARDTTSPATAAASDTAPSPTEMSPAPVEDATASAGQRTLPIGTEIHAALDDSINSRQDSVGRSVTAQISESVTGPGGKILIPAGSTVHLTVTRLGSAKSKGSSGQLGLRVDGIQLGSGLQSVQADVKPVPRELRGRGVGGSEAAKVGVGAAGGAVLGRVLGGNTKGAVIGGVVGAAGGAVVASQTATRDVVVKAKTPLVFVLTAPLVTP
ncbi:MAG: glycine zipper 2TM domain-containing protein [Gemmatimonadales bacterium]